jgi:hypothetical protein
MFFVKHSTTWPLFDSTEGETSEKRARKMPEIMFDLRSAAWYSIKKSEEEEQALSRTNPNGDICAILTRTPT